MKNKKQNSAPPRTVTFTGTIPPIETAIKVHGEGGARLMIDVAESDMGAFLPTLALRGKQLFVTLVERSG